MPHKNLSVTRFDEMDLNPQVFASLQDVGYATPTPIQALTIPHLIQGNDVLGQARTGTGKTAAFALPLLSRINLDIKKPQVLVLTPTRELAIQVSESFKKYGARMKGLNVLPVYGGQGYETQLTQLKRGVHVVVGTPGRLMDHMQRKTVSFEGLTCVVLDEADEMLHMGFIDDVEWILDKTPETAQTALFSATMPVPVRRIARKYLKDPMEISVQPDTNEMETISQQYLMVKASEKASALTRILDAIHFEGVIVFVRTKTATLELTRILEEKGFKAEALNGDIAQNTRERTINRLKNGSIDILVATDVAARGLDVTRISHVVNYDMPSKVEPYIHRIGRTGRAGRTGEAILFVNRNELWMLRAIEKTTKQTIREMHLPSNKAINEKRISDFRQNITNALASDGLDVFKDLIETYSQDQNIPVSLVAAAIAKSAHGELPFFLPPSTDERKRTPKKTRTDKAVEPVKQKAPRKRVRQEESPLPKARPAKAAQKKETEKTPLAPPPRKGMDRYRIEIGRRHGVCPGDIVGAISNEAGLDSKHIGSIDINREFSLVDLPAGMPAETFTLLKSTWVRSRQMSISKCA